MTNKTHNYMFDFSGISPFNLVPPPLRDEIGKRVPSLDAMEKAVHEARAVFWRCDDDFIATLNERDKIIYNSLRRDMELIAAINVANLSSAPLAKIPRIKKAMEKLNVDYPTIEARFSELRAMQKPSWEEKRTIYRDKANTFVKTVLDAKKDLSQTAVGKKLLMDNFNEELISSHKSYGWFVDGAKRDGDSIPRLLRGSSASPGTFADALNGRGHSHGLNTMIEQGRELSYIEEKSLAEAMKERLTASGLTSFQVKLYAGITQAYEKGKDIDKFIEKLWEKHSPEVEKLDEEWAARREAMSTKAASATQAQAAENIVAKEGKFLSGIKNLSGKARFGIAGCTVALLGAVGYWVWQSKHNKQQETSQQEAAVASR